MGFKCAWVACRGKSLFQTADELGLRPTTRREAVPDAEFCGLKTERGWTVVLNNFAVGEFLLERPLDRVLGRGEALTCYVNDTTMMSSISGFRDGVEAWTATHDAEEGLDHLELLGDPPEPLRTLERDLRARQGAADGADPLYDLAPSMSAALTGFRHDMDLPAPAQVLRRKWLGLL